LLCSDSLTHLVDLAILKQYILSSLSLEQKANALIQEANNRGGKDNISVVLVQIK
jgi:serine/threonine protein phosphatase PrpC